MKPKFFLTALLVCFLMNTGSVIAQNSGITSGAIYTLKSKSCDKLLNVSNSSIQNSANADCWTNTGSDAQRWKVSNTGNNVYTLTNVASGKLLHIAAAPADSVNVDQFSDTGQTDVGWIIKKAGRGLFYISPSANPAYSLSVHAADTADGANVKLAKYSPVDGQKWVIEKVAGAESPSKDAVASKIFDAWFNGYDMESVKGHFWDNAEMMEVVLDALEVTKDPKYKTMFAAMYKNFIQKNGADWSNNNYNDDIAWAVLFSVRGYLMTGNTEYRDKAKDQFDKMFARAFTNTYGGGLIWNQTKTSKNSCINGPAMVACCYLARATGDSSYYDKAVALYTWSKLYLFDPATGKLNDAVNLDAKTGDLRIGKWSSTYNQGTYLGAAVMLYKYTKEKTYLADAQKIALYIRDNMYNSEVINNEDGGNDLPGFKGIFARYARMYTVELNKPELTEWLMLNARVAYNNRNSQNLIQTKWATRTGEIKPKSAFGCSTAVSLIMNCLPLELPALQGCFPQDKLPQHITSLTSFGERADWSIDGKHVYFVDKAGGEVWEVDVKTKETRQITRPEDRKKGHGYYRVFCMANSDLLLCCGAERHRLYFQVLDKSFKNPPKTIEGGGWDEGGEGCDEGPAVSRTSMKIAWTTPGQIQIYAGEIAYSNGLPRIINKKLVVDYKNVVTVDGIKYENGIESQNWRPKKEEELIFSQYSTIWLTVERNKPTVEFRKSSVNNGAENNKPLGSNAGGAEVFGINLVTGKIINYSKAPDTYDEPEGIFPDGEYTLVECNKHKPSGGTGTIDLYKLKLDGSGDMKRLTFFADVEGYRASNPVVSDDGNFIVFSGSKASMDAGQGCGLYLFDIKKSEKAK